METTTSRTFRIEQIGLSELTVVDLRAESRGEGEERNYATSFYQAFRVWIGDEAVPAQALYVEFLDSGQATGGGRLGIAWGADATWGDVHGTWGDNGMADIERAIDEWLNNAEAWEARN